MAPPAACGNPAKPTFWLATNSLEDYCPGQFALQRKVATIKNHNRTARHSKTTPNNLDPPVGTCTKEAYQIVPS